MSALPQFSVGVEADEATEIVLSVTLKGERAHVIEAASLLKDYCKFHLGDLVAENMTAGPDGH